MIDLRRVRTAKLPLVAALHADPTNARRPLRELARLDRYERRALSRRDTADPRIRRRPCRTWQNLSENPNDINAPPDPSTTTR